MGRKRRATGFRSTPYLVGERILIVLKIGGDIYQKGLSSELLKNIKNVLQQNKLVIVHGGGDEVTRIAEKLGKKQVFIRSPGGIRSRYTDKETIEIFTMVMAGRINKTIVRWLQTQGISAVGLSGIDGGLLKARRKKRLIIIDERNRKRIIEGGFTGKIVHVNADVLSLLLESNYVPVVAPIALGEENEFLNVDADRAAAQIAGALQADTVIFLTDVQGLFLKNKYIRKLLVSDAEKLLPEIGPGMDKKVLASVEALKAGAKEAIISSGFAAEPITTALNHTEGTVITIE
ncbi:[LysW]-aminoadipate/[LysW]-glutamate kinase [Candidatus Bathyarchaeota archaeon]|nr:MAG: [LysW]-aminoadipate/[LysW]-glutamate kinase [Candidatus Bathyarchaeota archaeon]